MSSRITVSHRLHESASGWHDALQSGAVLVTVNQRLSRHHGERFHRHMLQNGTQWWETPSILPWQTWLTRLHDQALANGSSDRLRTPVLAQQLAWRRCIDADAAGALLLDPEATAALAQKAAATASQWECANEAEDYLSPDQLAYERWLTRYRRVQASGGRIDESDLANHLGELIRHDPSCIDLPSTLLLSGFLQLSPQQTRFLAVLEAAGVTLHSDGAEVASSFNDERGAGVSGANADVRIELHQDDDSELRSIAAQTRTLVEENASLRLAVVVSDLQGRRAAVLRAFDSVFFPTLSPVAIDTIERPYDVSLGLPLAHWPVVATGLSILRMPLRGLAAAEVSGLMFSPHLAGTVGSLQKRVRADLSLRERRLTHLDIEQLIDWLDEGDELRKVCQDWLASMALDKAGLGDWALRFGSWLKQLGWPGRSCTSDEYQAIQAWYGCLDDLQSLDEGDRVSAFDALALVERLSRERVFQPETPARPIQIMGRLESHGLQADHVWITGLDAEQWPAGSSPSPFLSIERQKRAKVPDASPALRLDQARRELALWRRSARHLILSRALTRDGNPLAAAAVLREVAETDSVVKSAARPAALVHAALSLQRVQDDHGPAVAQGSAVKGGSRLFENQALCPFKAFALHRLQIRPMEEAGIGMDPRQRGTFVHAALEAFWRDVQTHQALMALDASALASSIAAAVATAMCSDEVEIPVSLEALERRRVEALLAEWIESCEKPRTPFQAVGFEESMRFEHGGVQMNVKLDRVDEVNGSKVVIDYKTGASNSIGTWADERITNPQLPLYVLTDGDIEAASFAQVSRNQCAFFGVGSHDELLPRIRTALGEIDDWPSWRRHWQGALDAIALEVREGLASVTPMNGACTYCDLKPLCRIEQAAGMPVDDDPDTSTAEARTRGEPSA